MRPAHFEDYEHLTEIVPGVFYEPGDSVYIVDDQGEVVCWVAEEWSEDPEAVTATVTAVALAAKHGAAAVRENLKSGGERLIAMIEETHEVVS